LESTWIHSKYNWASKKAQREGILVGLLWLLNPNKKSIIFKVSKPKLKLSKAHVNMLIVILYIFSY